MFHFQPLASAGCILLFVAFFQTILQKLGEHLNILVAFQTEQDFQDRLNSYQGAGFSFEPVIWQLAWFRPHNISENFPGLYLVGAGTHPGPGVPGVLASAEIVAKLIPNADTIPESGGVEKKLIETNLEHSL